jgi:signal transduction histidine kinase
MTYLTLGLHRIQHALTRGMHKLRWRFERQQLPPALQVFARTGIDPLSLRLHDDVGQWLALGLLHLDDVRASQPDIHELLTPVRTSLERARQATREIIHGQEPAACFSESLLVAIQHTLTHGPWANHPLQCSLGDELTHIRAEDAPIATRIIRELVGNAHRHAFARDVRLRVWSDDGMLHIWVDDDGIGMANPNDHQHFGLRSLRYQVAREGGHLHLCAKPGIGTRITLSLPLRRVRA